MCLVSFKKMYTLDCKSFFRRNANLNANAKTKKLHLSQCEVTNGGWIVYIKARSCDTWQTVAMLCSLWQSKQCTNVKVWSGEL